MIKLFEKIKNQISETDNGMNVHYISEDFICQYNGEAEILKQSIDEFENDIKFMVSCFTYKIGLEKTEFSLFEPVNQNFYDMLTLEKRMETYIRDNLVLGTIHELFKLYKIKYLWPNANSYKANNSQGITNKYPLAFIVCVNECKIGYRLADDKISHDIDNIKKYIKYYDIHRFEIIRIDEKIKNFEYDDCDIGVPIQEITFKDFFNRYFSLNHFDDYILRCKEKMKWANNYLGFHVISSWSNKTNYVTRNEILDNLNRKLNDKNIIMKYKKIDDNNAINKYSCDYDLNEEEVKNIKYSIKDKKMFNCLLGCNDCAQSLISSEYLYNAIINESNMSAIKLDNFGFDFTVVACGYLKSIEQLLFIIFDMYTKTHNNEYYVSDKEKYTKIIHGLKYDGKNDCKVRKEIRSSDKDKLLNLGGLIYFLHLNLYKYFFNKNLEEELFHQLLQFSKECRNGYFHKHNIEKLNILKDLRSNTFYLLIMIIGGYKFEEINIDYKNYFNNHNLDYEKLYLELYEHSKHIKKYSILFDNEIINVHINDKLPKPMFDENGFMVYKNKSIIFYKDIDNYQISIDENHMPKQMWYKKNNDVEDRVEIHW